MQSLFRKFLRPRSKNTLTRQAGGLVRGKTRAGTMQVCTPPEARPGSSFEEVTGPRRQGSRWTIPDLRRWEI